MSLFGLLKRSKSTPPTVITPVRRDLPAPVDSLPAPEVPIDPPSKVSPDELRQMLFDAVATGDEARLTRLSVEHRDFIRDYADTWMIVPDSLLTNPAAAEWYQRGLQQLTTLSSAIEPVK